MYAWVDTKSIRATILPTERNDYTAQWPNLTDTFGGHLRPNNPTMAPFIES